MVIKEIEKEEGSLSLFIKNIEKYDPLPDEVVADLALKSKAGDMESRDLLVKHNLRFVLLTAKRYRNQGVPYVDLIEAGTIGLIKAAEKYVYNEDTKFLSYAVMAIRNRILAELAEMSRIFRIPRHAVNRIQDINKRIKEGEVLIGDDAIFYNSIQVPASLDAPSHNDDGDEKSDYLIEQVSKDVNEGGENFIFEEVSNLIRDEMERLLDDNELKIIQEYFGFISGKTKSMAKVSKSVGVSRRRVETVIKKSLKKLGRSKIIVGYYNINGVVL